MSDTEVVDDLEVTVLMPCLNEAETLQICIEKALASLDRLGIEGEVLVSDNGSTDGSQELAERSGARVVHAPVRGYGGALLTGIAAARGRYVIMADADDSYDLSNLGSFVDALREGRDLVMGNRFRGGIAPHAMPFLHRYLGNPILSRLGRELFRLKTVGDFHCGIRGFNRDRIRDLQLCMPGMEFASEMVVRASLAKYDIAEVPTTLQPDGRSRPPHLRTWRDGWRHLRFILAFAPRQTMIFPGLAMFLLGLVGTAVLVTGPVKIGAVTFDVNSLIYTCITMLVGSQVFIFGGLSLIYGRMEGITDHSQAARWASVFRLEVCISVGLALIVAGVFGTIWALSSWESEGFGPLSAPGQVVRLVLPSATAIAIGVLVSFAGLFASLLSLRPLSPTEAVHVELAVTLADVELAEATIPSARTPQNP
jgi:glycosyltransferase involved in cell wall biosynthesis